MKMRPGIILFILSIASFASAQQVATPTFELISGRDYGPRYVIVRCATAGAVVHYTTNGGIPNEGDPMVQNTYQVAVTTSGILSARAFKSGMLPSEVKSEYYTVIMEQPAFDPDGGVYAEPQRVRTFGGMGAAVFYTLDGTEPSLSSPCVTSDVVILVDHTLTLKAMSYKPGCEISPIKSAEYSFRDPVVWYVRTDGSDANSGSSWESAKRTVQAAVNTATAGDRIWVAEGMYHESIRLKNGIRLYGGFSGKESSFSERDFAAHETVLDGGSSSTIALPQFTYAGTSVDGFTIKGCGMWGNYATARIRNNKFNTSGLKNVGVQLSSPPEPFVIENNQIISNAGRGIWLWRAPMGGLVTNNTIIGSSIAILTFNTVASITNNVIAFNMYGIAEGGDGYLTLDHNCVFGNTLYDYSDYGYGEFPHPTDINVDPLFRDMANGDYRLRWDSPCIDAGTNEGAPTTDLAGSIRPMDGNHDGLAVADIGAYESPMPVAIDILADSIRLQPNKLVQVAILSDPVFSALNVDPATVFFGPGNAQEIHGKGHPQDINSDGLTDLLFHFSCAESGIVPGYQTVTLSGKLKTGEDFIGWDSVTAR